MVSATETDADIVITAEDIETMNAHIVSDILNHVPGVKAGDSSVSIHGSYKVRVFLDGRPLNDPTSSHGGVNLDAVTPDKIEKIEILRGKGGMKYGRDAAGGVILITSKGINAISGNVKAYGGNFGTGYGYVNLEKSMGKFAAGVSGKYYRTDGYKINNDKERIQAGVKMSYIPDEEKSFAFSANVMDEDKGNSGQPTSPTPYSRKDSNNTSLSLRSQLYGFTGDTFFTEAYNHNTDISRSLDRRLRVTELGQSVSSSAELFDWGELSYGGGFRLGKASGSAFNNQDEETYSVFAAHTLNIPGFPIEVAFGVRADMNSDFDDVVNPEVKAMYKRNDWRLTLSYTSAHNTPSFYQRHNESSSTIPNPDLNMEKAKNYGISLFVQLMESLSGNVSLYYNKLTDRITYVTGDDGMGQYQNFGKVTYKGGDIAFSWKANDAVNIKSGYTYLDAEDDDTGLRLPSKAKHRAHMDVYLAPVDPLSVVVSCSYTSMAYRNKANTRSVPEYTIVDVRAEYAFADFSVFTEIENLLDKDYFYLDGLEAPPFMWTIGVNYRF